MKTIKFLAAVALMAMAVTATAQVVSRSSQRIGTSSSSARTVSQRSSSSSDGWNRAYIQYNPTWWILSKGSMDDNYVNGLTAGYATAFNIGGPVYLEVGGGLQWYHKKVTETYEDYWYDEEYEMEQTMNMLSVRIPVNVVFDIDFGGFALRPYAGFYGRVNVVGKTKYEEDGHSEKVDLFDEEGGDYKRFQFGMEFGANAVIADKFTAGFGYNFDFNPIWKYDGGYKGKFGQLAITAGIIF